MFPELFGVLRRDVQSLRREFLIRCAGIRDALMTAEKRKVRVQEPAQWGEDVASWLARSWTWAEAGVLALERFVEVVMQMISEKADERGSEEEKMCGEVREDAGGVERLPGEGELVGVVVGKEAGGHSAWAGACDEEAN